MAKKYARRILQMIIMHEKRTSEINDNAKLRGSNLTQQTRMIAFKVSEMLCRIFMHFKCKFIAEMRSDAMAIGALNARNYLFMQIIEQNFSKDSADILVRCSHQMSTKLWRATT